MTNEEAEDLLNDEKDAENTEVDFSQEKTELLLRSKSDTRNTFHLIITQSFKLEFKISNHIHTRGVGLLRLDYKGRHKNPEVITDAVPEIIRPYIGKEFERDESHIHLYVDGFDLKWAVPVDRYGISVHTVVDQQGFQRAIEAFQKKINLTTKLHFLYGITP